MVKITAPGPMHAAAIRPQRPQAAGPAKFKAAMDAASDAGRASESTATDAVSISSSLLALQQSLEAGERDAEVARRTEQLLDELGGIQLGLLSGRLSRDQLRSLAALSGGAGTAADPRLAEIAEAVGLRAAVELAKLEAAEGRGDLGTA